MKYQRIIGLITGICISTLAVFSQNTEQPIPVPQKKYVKYLDLRFENGAMLSNDTDLGDQVVNSSYYNGIDVRLAFRKSDPYDIYSNVYRRPYLGVGWYASTFHNSDVGKPHALYFFLPFPLLSKLPINLHFLTQVLLAFLINSIHTIPSKTPPMFSSGRTATATYTLGFWPITSSTTSWQ